jgi:hypothetical protein
MGIISEPRDQAPDGEAVRYYEYLLEPVAANPRQREAWQARRRWLRDWLRERIGLTPAPGRTDAGFRVAETVALPWGRVERVVLPGWPGAEATGWLAVPVAGSGPSPLLAWIRDRPCSGPSDEELAGGLTALAAAGFTALTVDGVDLEEPAVGLDRASVLAQVHARGLEALARHPAVDPTRIGLFATGPGADTGAILLALEDRAAAAAVGFAGYFRDTPRARWLEVERTALWGILREVDRPELLGTLAPRPLLLLTEAGAAPALQGAVGEIRNIYGLYGRSDRVEVAEAPPGPFPGPAWDGVLGWLRRSLEMPALPPPGESGSLAGPGLARLRPATPATAGPGAWTAALAELAARRAAQPPRLEGRAARKSYQSRLRTALPPLLGEPPREVALGPVLLSEEARGSGAAGGRVEWWSLRSEAAARVRAAVFLPAAPEGPAALCVLPELAPGSAPALTPLQGACLAAGWTLVLLGTRLGLEGRPEWGPALHLAGRPAAGMAVRDTVAAIDYLTRRPGIDPRRIAVVGEGPAGIVALMAGGLDERVAAVLADAGGTLYRDAGTGLPRLPGILTLADVPQLASLVAPRPTWLWRVPGDRVGFSSRRYFDWTRRTYQSLGAEEALRMEDEAAPLVAEVVEWLRVRWRKR